MTRAAKVAAWCLSWVAYWTDRASGRLCRWARDRESAALRPGEPIFGRCDCYRGPMRQEQTNFKRGGK